MQSLHNLLLQVASPGGEFVAFMNWKFIHQPMWNKGLQLHPMHFYMLNLLVGTYFCLPFLDYFPRVNSNAYLKLSQHSQFETWNEEGRKSGHAFINKNISTYVHPHFVTKSSKNDSCLIEDWNFPFWKFMFSRKFNVQLDGSHTEVWIAYISLMLIRYLWKLLTCQPTNSPRTVSNDQRPVTLERALLCSLTRIRN